MKPFRAITWTDVDGREAGLIQRCAARDEDACAELVSEHQRMVYQLSLNLLGDHNEALDLSQEVFLRVFRTIHGFRGQSALRTWIYRIVVNQARNRQRWWRRRHRGQQVSLDEHLRDHGDFPERNDLESPDRLLGRKELADTDPDRARRAAVRPEDGARAAGNRRAELRRNRVLAGHRGRDGEVPAGARARSTARAIEGRMTFLTCAAVRRRLPAFYDRELPVPDQIAIESHVSDCPPCAGELEDIRAARRRAALRRGAGPGRRLDRPAVRRHQPHARRGARVVDRADRPHVRRHAPGVDRPRRRRSPPSSAARWRSAPCHFASPERDDSLAAMIAVISAPSGSDLNPVRNDQFLQVPTVPERGAIEFVARAAGDPRRAGAGAVCRGHAGRASVGPVGARHRAAPARVQPDPQGALDRPPRAGPLGASPVAVNLVWLLAHTTVKAKAPRITVVSPVHNESIGHQGIKTGQNVALGLAAAFSDLPLRHSPPSPRCSSRRSRG